MVAIVGSESIDKRRVAFPQASVSPAKQHWWQNVFTGQVRVVMAFR
jgi:hypothetical protein